MCDETNALCSFLNEGDYVGEDGKRLKYLWMCARGFVGLSACVQCIFLCRCRPQGTKYSKHSLELGAVIPVTNFPG